ncbi:MAG: AAA family ATPase [Gammaproteobacteria bacterium]|nr:AAA family ATPase [Gammaproteobacteria bacterium]
MSFRKAERKKAKLRLALCGPAGSGKTYSALLIAQGLALPCDHQGGRIALLDTERGSGELYSDLTPYDVATLTPPFSPERYIELIEGAGAAGYQVLIIDSLSHAWEGEGGCLELHDRATAASRSGNSYTAWREVTPQHNALVEAMLQSPCHVIATMRSKTAYELSDDGNGKKKPIKVGLAPVQRPGMEYEFTVVLDLSVERHIATATKDRTSLFDGQHFIPAPATGEALQAWLESGTDPIEASRNLLATLTAQVDRIEAVPHLEDWWRAHRAEMLIPEDLEALKGRCAARKAAILEALREAQPRLGNGRARAAA